MHSQIKFHEEVFGKIYFLGVDKTKTTVVFLLRLDGEEWGHPYTEQAVCWVFDRVQMLMCGDIHTAVVTRKIEEPLKNPRNFLRLTGTKLGRAIWESEYSWLMECADEDERRDRELEEELFDLVEVRFGDGPGSFVAYE